MSGDREDSQPSAADDSRELIHLQDRARVVGCTHTRREGARIDRSSITMMIMIVMYIHMHVHMSHVPCYVLSSELDGIGWCASFLLLPKALPFGCGLYRLYI